jgi:CheY-like chemotaxis protein
MHTDILSLRVLVVTPSASLRDLLRQGAGHASVPAEVMEADGAATAKPLIAQGSDLLLLDSGMSAAEKAAICEAARAARQRPFIIAVGNNGGAVAEIDGSVRKPATAEDAAKIVDCCMRSRRPTRVLIVDDSPTMRGIVRKILSASIFPLQVADSTDGVKALQQLRNGNFDIVLLDYNTPVLDGVEIFSELRRLQSDIAVVIMSSTDNAAVAERAQMAGAAAFLKKPFFPADVDALLYRLYQIEAPARAT